MKAMAAAMPCAALEAAQAVDAAILAENLASGTARGVGLEVEV